MLALRPTMFLMAGILLAGFLQLTGANWTLAQEPTQSAASAPPSEQGKEAAAKIQRDMKIQRDITYAIVKSPSVETESAEASKKLQLDLYLPDVPEAQRPPLLVWIHGGGWRGGSRNKPPVRRLVDHGYAIASISYRFTDEAIFPAQIHDCKAAIRFLRANAAEYGYDSTRIGVGGSSAGGYLALLVGASCGVQELEGDLGDYPEVSSCVTAVVDYFGPSDFVLRGKTQPEMAYSDQAGSYALLGGTSGKIAPELERRSSPASYVGRRSPPLLVFHGEEDQRVLIDQSEHIAALYKSNQREVELVRVPSAGHGGLKFFMDENFQKLTDFLDSHLANSK